MHLDVYYITTAALHMFGRVAIAICLIRYVYGFRLVRLCFQLR